MYFEPNDLSFVAHVVDGNDCHGIGKAYIASTRALNVHRLRSNGRGYGEQDFQQTRLERSFIHLNTFTVIGNELVTRKTLPRLQWSHVLS